MTAAAAKLKAWLTELRPYWTDGCGSAHYTINESERQRLLAIIDREVVAPPKPKFKVGSTVYAANEGERPAYRGKITDRWWTYSERKQERGWGYHVHWDGLIQDLDYSEDELVVEGRKLYARRW